MIEIIRFALKSVANELTPDRARIYAACIVKVPNPPSVGEEVKREHGTANSIAQSVAAPATVSGEFCGPSATDPVGIGKAARNIDPQARRPAFTRHHFRCAGRAAETGNRFGGDL